MEALLSGKRRGTRWNNQCPVSMVVLCNPRQWWCWFGRFNRNN